MKILILGSDDFIGKHILDQFKNSPYKIYNHTEKDKVSLLKYGSFLKYLKKINPDVIYNTEAHVGGVHYVTDFAADVVHDNMLMILNLFKAVKEAARNALIISPLSNCSYPGDANIHSEPKWWHGEVHDSVYAYGNAKRMLYVVAKCYKKQYGIQSANFLIPNFFGPFDHLDPKRTHALGGMMIRMIKAHREDQKEFEVWGTGNPIREWGYIKDIAKVLKNALHIRADLTYPVNIGQNKGFSIKESALIIKNAIGYKGKIVFNTKFQDGAPIKILEDKKFREIFPKFKFTDHQKAIQETVKYYLAVL